MASSLLLTLLLTTTIATAATATVTTTTTAPICKEKTIYLNFYVNEILSGSNATIVDVVPPLSSNSTFGLIHIIDSELTTGQEAMSKRMGRAQGFVVGTSKKGSYVSITYNFVLSKGQYCGSSLLATGRFGFDETTRLLSIIGGTGEFKLARGYVVFKAAAPLSSQRLIFKVEMTVVLTVGI